MHFLSDVPLSSAKSVRLRHFIVIGLSLALGNAPPPAQAQDTVLVQTVPPPIERMPPLSPLDVSPAGDRIGPATLSVPPAPSFRSGIRWTRFALASGILTAYYTTQYVIERRKWWSQQTVDFHFDSSPSYARGMDKIAHFYGAEIQAMTNARLLEWTGMRSSKAALWGAVLSFAGQTNVEIHDGFSREWGFDVYDQLANGLGVAWFYAHDRISPLRRFDVRLSYWHPNAPPIDKSKDITPFTNDYSGHVYWLSMRVWDLLPKSLQAYWPRFLQFSVGVSLNDWEHHPDDDAYLSTHVSVDIDWREIIPRNSLLGRTAGDVLNRYHLPVPALQVTPRLGISLFFVGQ
jgi:hypothetical protein